MFKRQALNLLEHPEKAKSWISTFDNVLCDCDGVLWLYDKEIEGSVKVVNRLKQIGKGVYFATNNSTKTRPEFLEKAIRMGFNMKEDEILSTAYTAAQYLKNRNFNKKVYVIGSTGITKELDAVGIKHTGVGPDYLETNLANFLNNKFEQDDEVGAVIVGFDEYFSFPKMTRAASYLSKPNSIFIATNTDERFPMPNFVVPGTGSIVKAIETCAERSAVVMGKPNANMCEPLLVDGKITPERTLMVGDRCNTDILFGNNCGFQTLLVGTGIHNLDDVSCYKKSNDEETHKLIPDAYLPKFGDLLQFLL
ncbi:glycerol-3-phosphate phosphatase [Condylostylus longicornis]|uniref:glycerol-3-phosphate phosphatase n=1 Tax=Condylostylus longicornis TaxID=2530218 RepID=UPI00244E5370|nr:glycerol-3-phosphate phosphatase [Condylostylus longicornis]